MITLQPHPLLDLRALEASWPRPLGAVDAPPWLGALGALDAPTPFPAPGDAAKGHVRDLLRHGGYKPSGRGKPCNEYLLGVAGKGAFPAINPAVDATNVAALHGGLPISTVDADRLEGPLRVGVAPPGSSYVFNAAGQTIDLGGLLCLSDARGPCANAVKDAQRTKTHDATTRSLTVVWGTTALPGRAEAVAAWLGELFQRLGATVRRVEAG